MKGFMAFVLGAVLLLAFVSAAAKLSQAAPSSDYKRFYAFGLQETAIKQSFYSATSYAAAAALAQQAGGADPAPVQLAIHTRAVLLEQELQSAGFDAIFWCGSPTESEKEGADKDMGETRRAVLPPGTSALSPLSCQDSFLADLEGGKIHISNFGFSFYSDSLGIGRAAVFPSSYEVDFIGPQA